MRGTQGLSCSIALNDRIIPAHAGNTDRESCAWCPRRDHPRACGEHMPPSCSILTVLGSSPRMRGTLCPVCLDLRVVGIIPAHAGNTAPFQALNWLMRDHPRACGEHTHANGFYFKFLGSSPRMRGTLFLFGRRRRRGGIIPAHAGNTDRGIARYPYTRDHPRACGEHPISSLYLAK